LHENPELRADIEQFLETTKKPPGFFANDFIKANIFLENINIKDSVEKERFFRYWLLLTILVAWMVLKKNSLTISI
jgi:hypothetical protein